MPIYVTIDLAYLVQGRILSSVTTYSSSALRDGDFKEAVPRVARTVNNVSEVVVVFRILVVSFLCITFGLSSGCALMNNHYAGSRGDSAPDFNVDVSRIPNAVPHCEKRLRSCNPSHYRVCGKTYHVMKSAANYHERGTASWYGTRFYKGKTATGECYNMLAMTAAHKTLPIPSYVRVTHLKTHKSIIVKVNDRGPFKPGRVIDLSYVAAKKLGMTNSGIAPVEVTALEPGSPASPNGMIPPVKEKKSSKKAVKKKRSAKKKTSRGHHKSKKKGVKRS